MASWGFPLFQDESIFILNFQLVILVYRNAEPVFVANWNCLKSNCLRERVASFLLVFSHAIYRYLEIFPRNVFISPFITRSSHCLPQSVSLILLDDKKPCVRHLVPPPTWAHECFSGDQPIPSDPMSVMVWDFEKTFSHTQCSTLTHLTFAL